MHLDRPSPSALSIALVLTKKQLEEEMVYLVHGSQSQSSAKESQGRTSR